MTDQPINSDKLKRCQHNYAFIRGAGFRCTLCGAKINLLEAAHILNTRPHSNMGVSEEMIGQAHMAGQIDAGVDPSYSNAQTYVRELPDSIPDGYRLVPVDAVKMLYFQLEEYAITHGTTGHGKSIEDHPCYGFATELKAMLNAAPEQVEQEAPEGDLTELKKVYCPWCGVIPHKPQCALAPEVVTDVTEVERVAEIIDERIAELEAQLKEFHDVMADSTGVAGYHLNGDIALWDEFDLPTPPT